MEIRILVEILLIIGILGTTNQKLQVIEPKSLAVSFHKDQLEGKRQKAIWSSAFRPLETFPMIKKSMSS